MKKKKKFLLKILCLLTAGVSLCSFSGCGDILNEILQDFFETTQIEYGETDWNPEVDGSIGGGSLVDPTPSNPDGENGSGTTPTPTPDTPNPEKELLYTQTDEIGHKIAYYKDGSKEDLGRAIPLDFSSENPENKYGYQYFSTLLDGAELCALYKDLYRLGVSFHTSQKDAVSVSGNYEIAEFRYADYGLSKEQATAVWRTVAIEYPEFFWWSNSLLVGNKTITLLADGQYAKGSVRAQTQAYIEEIVRECDEYIDGTKSLTERALTIHDYIVNEMDYAYESDGVTPESELWAHNIAGIAVNKASVCEGYAKTFDYLCGFFGLQTLTVVGEAYQNGQSIGHAWNLLYLDEEWYPVDATWNDYGGQGVSREFFGMAEGEFSKTHIPTLPTDGWGVDFQVEMPTMSQTYLSPTRISGNGADDEMLYATVEDALATAKAGGSYSVYLYPETVINQAGLDIVGRGATLNQTEFSFNGNITLVGSYQYYQSGYYLLAEIDLPNGLTLKGDLTLQDLCVLGKNLSLGANTLKLIGSVAEIYVDGVITGANGSLLQSQTSEWTALGAVDLYEISAEGEQCRLEEGGKISRVEIHSGVFRLYGKAGVNITKLWYGSTKAQLYIDQASAKTEISIGNIEMDGAIGYTGKAIVYLVYSSASSYPIITVGGITSCGGIYLALYSEVLAPTKLGKSLMNIDAIPYSKMTVVYSSGGSFQTVTSYFQKDTNGDILAK